MTFLNIVKTAETKSFLKFEEVFSGTKIYLEKSDFNRILEHFKYWRRNQSSTNFTSQLFSLMCKADDANKIKFLKGFPKETVVWLLWYTHKDGEAGFFKEHEQTKYGKEGELQWIEGL